MKKIFGVLSCLILFSCATPIVEDDSEFGVVSPDNVVRIEITTQEPNDEIFVNYYVYQTDDYSLELYPFSYNTQGEATPVVITLNNYNFRYIEGETYRNRSNNKTPLTLKIFLNNELIVDEISDSSSSNTNGLIRFNYDIVKKENI